MYYAWQNKKIRIPRRVLTYIPLGKRAHGKTRRQWNGELEQAKPISWRQWYDDYDDDGAWSSILKLSSFFFLLIIWDHFSLTSFRTWMFVFLSDEHNFYLLPSAILTCLLITGRTFYFLHRMQQPQPQGKKLQMNVFGKAFLIPKFVWILLTNSSLIEKLASKRYIRYTSDVIRKCTSRK